MPISPARLAANQRNATKSCGPKTAEGKARSRANALKHGLRATVVGVADEATLHARTVGVIETFRPQNEFQLWLCTKIARDTVQLDHVEVVKRQALADVAHRAEFCWDEDQQVEANRVARGLSRNPDRTVGLLRRSVAGCDWLIARWAMLADSADRQPWTDEQTSLAHDLLGTPPEFRADAPTYLIDDHGRAVVPSPTEAELAHAYLDELREHRDAVLDDDEVARTLAMANLDEWDNRAFRPIHRAERSLRNDFHNACAMVQHESPRTITDPRLLRLIPAHFFAAPTPAPNEPKPDRPNEPKPDAAEAPPEPTTPPLLAAPPAINAAQPFDDSATHLDTPRTGQFAGESRVGPRS